MGEENTLVAKPGPVVVDLPEKGTTGFHWELRAHPNEVRLVRDERLPTSSGGVMGGASSRRFHLEVSTPGAYDLVFALRRRWESEPREIRTVHLVVEAD